MNELTARDHQMDVYERLQEFTWLVELGFDRAHEQPALHRWILLFHLQIEPAITDFELAATLEDGDG